MHSNKKKKKTEKSYNLKMTLNTSHTGKWSCKEESCEDELSLEEEYDCPAWQEIIYIFIKT